MVIKHFFSLPTHRIWRLPAVPQKHHCFQTGVLTTKWNEINKRLVLGDFYLWASDCYRENQFTAMMADIKRKLHKTNNLFKNGWLKWKLKCLTMYGSSEISNILSHDLLQTYFLPFYFLYIYNCFRFFLNCNTTYFFHCSYKKTIKM